MSSLLVDAVTNSTVLGEAPHWDTKQNVLFYVDIIGSEVRKYDPQTNEDTATKIDGPAVSFIIAVQNQANKFIVGIGHTICLLTWNGESDGPTEIEKLAVVDEEEEKIENKLNDGKADAVGRLWAGTLGEFVGEGNIKPCQGSFYSFMKHQNVMKHVNEITCSNGLTWSPDNKILYYIDSPTLKVDAFDFDLVKGDLSNRRTIFNFETSGVAGMPDGMTVDVNGNLWIACFNGSKVIQIDPQSGKILQSIEIPSPQVTSVAFGGINLDELYVTTGTIFMSPEVKEKYPLSGCTFRIKGLDTKGLPMNNFVLN